MAQLQFVSFSSWVDSSFWHALSQEKIDKEGLNDRPRPVLGSYDAPLIGAARPRARLEVRATDSAENTGPLGYCQASGSIKNFNTFETFKSADKNELLHACALELWNAIHDGSIYDRLSLLSLFTIISFADLKKYKFVYWFAFPAIVTPWMLDGARGNSVEELVEEKDLDNEVLRWRQTEDVIQHGFFTVRRKPVKGTSKSNWEVGSLAECEHDFLTEDDSGNTMVGFVDPSFHASAPGWPIRNLLALASYRWKVSWIRILCLRDNLAQFKAFDGTDEAKRFQSKNVIMSFAHNETLSNDMPKVVGWERNLENKLSPRVADLAPMMDPRRLADTAVDLNLKLMKWRILPQLKLDRIKETRCLLLGAGTLGSYVARNLLAWGVRTITLVDNATVSFSNPVRQPLFSFQDCLQGGKAKAPTAAQSLKQIYPGVEATGYQLSVPMLGHPSHSSTMDDFNSLEELFNKHDAIFLLMDSRESRWLPTVMGAAKHKIVINAALGFDTHVVLRHGMRTQNNRLGCYFCNDVVAPVDSLSDRTLDQMCTVTRPGLAPIASATAVELLISIIQHQDGAYAPAPSSNQPGSHSLDLVPHQLRGFLATYQTMMMKGSAYNHCSACSDVVVDEYLERGWDFVRQALDEKQYVERLSGLQEVQQQAMRAAEDDIEWSSDSVGGGYQEDELEIL